MDQVVTRDLKSVVRKDVRVRLPPSAPIISLSYTYSLIAIEFAQRS